MSMRGLLNTVYDLNNYVQFLLDIPFPFEALHDVGRILQGRPLPCLSLQYRSAITFLTPTFHDEWSIPGPIWTWNADGHSSSVAVNPSRRSAPPLPFLYRFPNSFFVPRSTSTSLFYFSQVSYIPVPYIVHISLRFYILSFFFLFFLMTYIYS